MGKPSAQASPQKYAAIPVHSLLAVTCIPGDGAPKAGLQEEAGSLGAGGEVTDQFS